MQIDFLIHPKDIEELIRDEMKKPEKYVPKEKIRDVIKQTTDKPTVDLG